MYLIKFQIHWLEQARYYLKLQHGLSKPYHSTKEHYLYGTGQGTDWSPPSWGALSDLISRAMERHVPGIKLIHPNNTLLSEKVMEAFVDDVTSGLNDFDNKWDSVIPKRDSITQQIQINTEFYSQLLHTTGGFLALHKCAIYILITVWKKGYRTYEKTHEQIPGINIK